MDKSAIQQLVDDLFRNADEEDERTYEYYVVTAEKFQKAITRASSDLSVSDFKGRFRIDETEIDNWVIANLSTLSSDPLRNFYEKVDEVMVEVGLPKKWRRYVAIYLVKNMPPETNAFPPSRYITVENADDNSVTIKLRKGIRFDEYMKSWGALSQHLGKARRKPKKPDNSTRIRDLQMLGKQETYGSTHRQLAEEYVHNSINIDDAKDTVKKALKRQKKLRQMGTDLTK